MADPNPKVNLAGSGTIPHVQRPDGLFVPQAGTDDGAANVALVGAAESGLATETTAQSIDTDTTALASTVVATQPVEPFPGVAVRIGSSIILTTQPSPSFAASAPAAGNDTPNGTYVYFAGLDRENVGAEVDNWALVTKAWQGGEWSISQGIGNPGKPWYVRGTTDLDEPERLATAIGQTDGSQRARITNGIADAAILDAAPVGTELGLVTRPIPSGTQTITGTVTANIGTTNGLALDATVQAVRDRLPTALDGGRLAVETELAATGSLATEAKQTSIEGKLGALVAQEATTAKNTTLTDGTQKAIVRGAAKGTTPAADATTTALGPDHQGLDINPDVNYNYSPGRESTGAYKASNRVALFNNVNQYFLDTRAWGTITATGGTVTYNTLTGSTDIAVTGSSGSLAVLQTHTYFPYEPEATTHPLFTIAFAAAVQVNQIVRIGYFNDLDGIFYERTTSSLRLVRRSSVTGVAVDTLLSEQVNWADPYSDLNLLFGNRFGLDIQWLSFGKIRAIINDRVVQVHELGNTIPEPYMRTAQRPLRFEIRNTGASVANTIRYTCASVSLHSGTDLKTSPGIYPLSAPRAGITTTPTPLLGLRIAALLAGRANRGIILPQSATLTAESGAATIDLYFNPTSVVGGAWAATSSTSGVEYNEGITSITGGERAGHIIIPATGAGGGTAELDGRAFFSILGAHLRVAVDGTLDTMVFVGNARVGTVTLDVVARWLRAG